jgi:hypothetical protein
VKCDYIEKKDVSWSVSGQAAKQPHSVHRRIRANHGYACVADYIAPGKVAVGYL